ncbi:hypothetical protein WJX72_007148 [[Myrmecia] bisecta]|uniref:GPI inositol-deacylase n=1 Tax=[Myrmecia] bisecta TaxID=41462 RepID=A0AAW1PKC1_9CHLO
MPQPLRVPGSTFVDLPPLSQRFPGLPDTAYNSPRPARALLYPPRQGAGKGGEKQAVPVIIFAHGFSQGPDNYTSLINQFSDRGWLVIAPTTTFDKMLFPWQRVETTDTFSSLQDKLQSALVLDLLRSYQYLKDNLEDDYEITDVLVCGHSMGGASALVVASYLKDTVKAVGVMAPAVKQTVKSNVNPLLHFDGSRVLSPTKYRASASKFFTGNNVPADVDVHLLGADDDLVVAPEEVEDIYLAALTGRKDDITGHKPPEALAYYRIPWGSHIGFEDSVNLDIDLGRPVKLLFLIVDLLIYQWQIFDLINPSDNFRKQKKVTRAILCDLFASSLGQPPLVPQVHGIANVGGPIDDPQRPYSLTPIPSTEEMLREKLPKQEKGNVPLEIALLFTYAAIQGTSSFVAGRKLLETLAANQWHFTSSDLGLAIITAISAGLVWENVILGSGRLITKDGTSNLDVLQSLNDPRFLFHSLAPLLSVAGVNVAARAGVSWAASPAFISGLSLVLSIVVAISLINNTLLLQTRPTWSFGILHFTYEPKPFDFTRIIPVAATTVFLLALGVGAAKSDPALWPLPAGAGICLALSAGIVPRSVAPMILTGNFGEVCLLAGLVLAELRL